MSEDLSDRQLGPQLCPASSLSDLGLYFA